MKKRVVLYIFLVTIFFFFNFYFRPISGNSLITKEYKKSSAYINNLYYSNELFKEKILKKSEYNIYERIIDASLKNESTVEINCLHEECASTFLSAYDAVYLDHPELLSFYGIDSYEVKGNSLTYYNYQHLSSLKRYFGTLRIERELDNIRRDTKNMNDKEKIIYVYDYVASHNYDRLFTYIGSNQSAYSFFTKGSSVCAGFAKASQLIFQNIGINSYLVLSDEHMWNYVEYKGKYYVFDATVGASYTKKDYKGFYDGLGETTVENPMIFFEDIYPNIESKKLKDIFKL